jgi:hypothetical protein
LGQNSKTPLWSVTTVPARPVPWQDFELVLLSLCPETMK